MANPHGTFIWYELLTTDPDAAQRFYGDVIGWNAADSGQEGIDYRLFSAPDGDLIGGLMKQPDGMPGGPLWLGYVGVDDVDAAVRHVEEQGGAVHMPADDIPGVGRIAMVADPQHSPFYLMRGSSDEASTSFMQGETATPGHAVWNELTARDADAALAFYTGAFGWRQEGSIPIGDLGEYRFLHVGAIYLGGLTGHMPDGPVGWHYYFLVPDLDTAIERIESKGGRITSGPDEIPGGAFSLLAEDPQGARFGLVGSHKS